MNRENLNNKKAEEESKKITYLGQLNGFSEYMLHNLDMPTNERVLFYALLIVWNKKGRPDVLEATSKEINPYSGLGRETQFKAMRGLFKRGLFVSYTPATRSKGYQIQLADLKKAHKSGFTSLLENIQSKNSTAKENIQSKNSTAKENIQSKNSTADLDSVENAVENTVDDSVENLDRKQVSSINKNKSNRVIEYFSFSPSESEKISDQNSKNKKEEEKNFLTEYQKDFIGGLRKKWDASMQLKFPRNDPDKVAKINEQIVAYCEKYTPEVVEEAFDYCIGHPWLSGHQPDSKGNLFDTQLEWMLRPEIFTKMVNKEFYIRRTAQVDESSPGAYPDRSAQYAENLQKDYDWFYGDNDPDYPDKDFASDIEKSDENEEYGSDSDFVPPIEGPVPPLDREDPTYYDEYGWIDCKGNELTEEEAREYFTAKEKAENTKSAESGALSAIPSSYDTSDIKF